jgi:hypothetical protein
MDLVRISRFGAKKSRLLVKNRASGGKRSASDNQEIGIAERQTGVERGEANGHAAAVLVEEQFTVHGIVGDPTELVCRTAARAADDILDPRGRVAR